MNDNMEKPDALETLAAIVIGGVVVLSLIFSLIGCSSVKACPECIPKVETVEVKVPVRVCEKPPIISDVVLPEWPELQDNPTQDELKSWYAEMVSVLKAREKILRNRINLLNDILEGYKE